MMKWAKKSCLVALLSASLLVSTESRADFWGGDIPLLIQIVANTLQQLAQLRAILATGSDTLGLLRDVNRGIKDGLGVIQIINPRFNPGLYGNIESADRVLAILGDMYGRVPLTGETQLQTAQDQSAAESIAMNGTLFRYADQVDDESREMIAHARVVNPQGAAKLTAQSLAVLIGVTTQVLRTNSMMLKMMGENMALQNRKEKIASAQFKAQYDGLSNAMDSLPKDTKLPNLGGP